MTEERARGPDAAREPGSHRMDVDLVRFEAHRLDSGLYRHEPSRVVIEMARSRPAGAQRR